jgi:uncharacterized membrane protein
MKKPELVRNTFQKTSREMQMANTKILVSSALSALATLATTAVIAQSTYAKKPNSPFDKYDGTEKASLIGLQTHSRPCAETSTADDQYNTWLNLSAGTCSKLSGGNNLKI